MKFADISIEIGHFYMSELQSKLQASNSTGEVRDFISARMDAGYAAITPIVKRYEAHKKRVSVVVLVDDYFWTKGYELSREDIAEYIREYSAQMALPLDFVVFESALAESVDTMFSRIVPFPVDGSGSRQVDSVDRSRWLSNGQAGRRIARASSTPRLGISRPEDEQDEIFVEHPRPHSLHIDVEMYADDEDGVRKWACPLLAAWWQLIRLGMLRDSKGEACCPPDTIAVQKDSILFAKRTLTVLASDFLEIEAAVRTILSQVSIPRLWQDQLRDGSRIPESDEHLSRIGYIFLPEGFHPHGLSGTDSWT